MVDLIMDGILHMCLHVFTYTIYLAHLTHMLLLLLLLLSSHLLAHIY